MTDADRTIDAAVARYRSWLVAQLTADDGRGASHAEFNVTVERGTLTETMQERVAVPMLLPPKGSA